MANNVVSINVYKFNQQAPLSSAQLIAFPTTGCILRDVSGSPTRDLGNGVNVYSAIQVVATGTLAYCRETYATILAAFNA